MMKIISVQKITDGPHLNLFEIAYQDTAQHDRIWRIACRQDAPKSVSGRFDLPDAVVIVPYHVEKKKIVLIKEFRVPLGDYQYGFPAGLMDPGETIEQTTIRELYEETGLAVLRILRVSPPMYSSSGLTDESVAIVFAECRGEPFHRENTGSEEIFPLMVSPEEAAALCGDRELKFDVKTWLILCEYARTGTCF